MPKTYVLVDLQNRQPEPAHIASWIGTDGEVWIFYGEHELNLLPHYFEIGPQVSIVPISRPGQNALDFHLVMYLGYLIAKCERSARFVVVAGDRDYDAAIEHACAQGFRVERVDSLSSSGIAKSDIVEADPPSVIRAAGIRGKGRTAIAVYAGVLRDLRSNRPNDLKALRNRIESRLGQETSTSVDEIIAHLVTMDVVDIREGLLRYLNQG